jgi:hypothetical protein
MQGRGWALGLPGELDGLPAGVAARVVVVDQPTAEVAAADHGGDEYQEEEHEGGPAAVGKRSAHERPPGKHHTRPDHAHIHHLCTSRSARRTEGHGSDERSEGQGADVPPRRAAGPDRYEPRHASRS